jgi:hypothetical protein
VITADPNKDPIPEKNKRTSGSENKEADMMVKDWYCNKTEYNKLTPQQNKLVLKLKREKRQGSDGKKSNQSKKTR